MESWGVRLIGRCECGGVAEGFVGTIAPSREAAEGIAAVTWRDLIAEEDGGGVVEIWIERISNEEVPPEEGGRWAHPEESYRWPVTHRQVRRCPPTPVATSVGDISVYCVPGGWAFGGDDEQIAETFPSWDEAVHEARLRVASIFSFCSMLPTMVRMTRIRKVGGSLDVRLTRELHALGLDDGDRVEVAVRRLKPLARRGRAGPPPPGHISGGGAGARPPL